MKARPDQAFVASESEILGILKKIIALSRRVFRAKTALGCWLKGGGRMGGDLGDQLWLHLFMGEPVAW